MFADTTSVTWQGLVSQLLRFIPRLRNPEPSIPWPALQQAVDSGTPLPVVICRLVLMERALSYQELSAAIRQNCL
ncbi:MAG: hypothetical protein HC824_02550 [Synechococcales cyanobacterium RM1_1_8]|nr:hypothetical protein [Synechococcales cyanobacterium RM1_1_8]